jgi:hypothetical protein
LRLRIRDGQLDDAEGWKEDDGDLANIKTFSVHRQFNDTSPNHNTFSQTHVRNIAAADLSANETTAQFVHHCPHCDLLDDCQCAGFFLSGFPQGPDFPFSGGKHRIDVYCSSNDTEGNEPRTGTSTVGHVCVPSQLSE